MADKPVTDKSTAALTVAQAAKAVGIAPAALFSYRDYGDHVVVVTVEGRKLDSREARPA